MRPTAVEAGGSAEEAHGMGTEAWDNEDDVVMSRREAMELVEQYREWETGKGPHYVATTDAPKMFQLAMIGAQAIALKESDAKGD